MFTERSLPTELADLHTNAAPTARVLDCAQEFETMPEDWVYELALITDGMSPLHHPEAWVPADAPVPARRTTGRNPAIGMPDDGSVAWTRQTDPPLVFVKPRAETVPAAFRALLIAEALLEVDMDVPETPVCFFGERYGDLHDLADSPLAAFQLAAAFRTAWIGRRTRPRFTGWRSAYPDLHAAWADAGNRLAARIADLPSLVADDRMAFADATELACSGIKHDVDLPSPYASLDAEEFSTDAALEWLARQR